MRARYERRFDSKKYNKQTNKQLDIIFFFLIDACSCLKKYIERCVFDEKKQNTKTKTGHRYLFYFKNHNTTAGQFFPNNDGTKMR